MPSPSEINLLLGLLAIQLEFISADGFVLAMQDWSKDKSRSFGEVLKDEAALSDARLKLLEEIVREHLQVSGNESSTGGSFLSIPEDLSTQLKKIGNPEVVDYLSRFSNDTPEDDCEVTETVSPTSHFEQSHSRFRIVRPLEKGAGGMGVVLVANDLELSREVALKQLHERYADDDFNKDRFLLEAEITGKLEHPGIVPVYGLGRYLDGRVFYAMRLIKGVNLKHSIDTLYELPESSRRLSFQKLITHFVAVCHTVHFAHCRGILHRDLKPSNIMIGKHGEALVVDWGLAKTLGETSDGNPSESPIRTDLSSGTAVTKIGSVIGTPAYMSPEQAEGRHDELTPASDVYSLGATLYCLLTGNAPFNRKQLQESQIDGAEPKFRCPLTRGILPKKPTSVNAQLVDRRLESICLKAMSVDVEDRYMSASDLADDIELWRADEPVSATAESTVDRVLRWTRRHRAWVTALGLGFSTIFAVVVASALILNKAWQSEKTSKQIALTNANRAKQVVSEWLTGAEFNIRWWPGARDFRQRLLEEAIRHFEDLARGPLSDDPDLKLEYGRTMIRLAGLYAEKKDTANALKRFHEADKLFLNLARRFPNSRQFQREMANSKALLADFRFRFDHEEDDALNSFVDAIQILERTVQRHPNSHDSLEALANIRILFGLNLRTHERNLEASKQLQQAVQTLKSLHEASSSNRDEFSFQLATAEFDLSQVLYAQKQSQEAQKLIASAHAKFSDLYKQNPNRWDYAASYASCVSDRGAVLAEHGIFAEAEPLLEEAILEFKQLATTFEGDFEFVRRTAITLARYGRLGFQVGADGGEHYQNAVRCYGTQADEETLNSEEQMELAMILAEWAAFQYDKVPADSEANFRRAREIWRKLTIESDSPSPQIQMHAAWFYANCAHPNFRSPETAIRGILDLQKKNRRNPFHLTVLAVAYYRSDEISKSIATLERAFELREDDSSAIDLFMLALCHFRAGNRETATKHLLAANNRMAAQAPNDPELVRLRDEATAALDADKR